MISRTWHGIVPIKMKNEFAVYLEATGVCDTTAITGNRGAYVKIVEQGEYAHSFYVRYGIPWKALLRMLVKTQR